MTITLINVYIVIELRLVVAIANFAMVCGGGGDFEKILFLSFYSTI